jgi:hypothetical protein
MMPWLPLGVVRKREQFLGIIVVACKIGFGPSSIMGDRNTTGSLPNCSQMGTTFWSGCVGRKVLSGVDFVNACQ